MTSRSRVLPYVEFIPDLFTPPEEWITLYSWKPDLFAMAMDAFQLSWKGQQGYAFPPFTLIGRCTRKVWGQSTIALVTPSGGHRLCSQFSWIWRWITHYASHETGFPKGPPQQTTPTVRPREPSASHLESFREHLSAAGILQKAAELLPSRWSQVTNVVYQST